LYKKLEAKNIWTTVADSGFRGCDIEAMDIKDKLN